MINYNKIEYAYSAGISSQLLECKKPEIVFSGKSNVGKSSLINKLTNRKNLARVSSQPGKTSTINFFDLDEFTLVDLPGYGFAKVSNKERDRWAELVEGYFNQNRDIRLVIQICDIRHKLSADDMNMINYLYQNNLPFIVVLSKKDKLNKTEYNKRIDSLVNELSFFEDLTLFPYSALNNDGIDEIRDTMERNVLEVL